MDGKFQSIMLQSLMTCCPKPHAKKRRIAQPFILQTLFHLKCNELTETTRNSFLGSIRTKTSLPTSIRETAICRVAVLNKAWYEWESHSPILESAEGTYTPSPPLLLPTSPLIFLSFTPTPGHLLTLQQDVTNPQVLAVLNSPPTEPLEALGAKLSAVLAYTDAMTLDVRVPDSVFEQLRTVGFSEKEIVEITATVAAYNCVSRFLVALDVGERNAQTGPKEGGKE